MTVRGVASETRPGYHCDGDGLYLQVTRSGDLRDGDPSPGTVARSWIFRYKFQKRSREMGLGSARLVSLAEARLCAARCRQLLADGKDPVAVRREERSVARAAEARRTTFDECATAYIAAHRDGWRNTKHGDQWENSLRLYASPVIGKLPVAEVSLTEVMRILDPIWRGKTETASRLRGRIEAVLDWSTVRGYRSGENPARWRGHLDHLLPAPGKVAKVAHYAAVPFTEIAEFMARLRAQSGLGALALEFAILTAARSGEVRGATWTEFDLDNRVWTVPAARMKAAREHRVPLSDAALAVLKQVEPHHHAQTPADQSLVFPSNKGQALSDMTLSAVLRRMKVDAVPHGFRSTFRDWCAERTNFPREVAEMALAHAIGDKVEAAYRRGDLFDKRTALMNAWAAWCARGVTSADSTVDAGEKTE